MADLVQPGEPLTEYMLERQRPPVYRTPLGKFVPITGRAADEWPWPRTIQVGGREFVERPIPSVDGWGLTLHCRRDNRNPADYLIYQYAEGRASGFPLWPTLVFSVRWTTVVTIRRFRGWSKSLYAASRSS